MQNANNFIDNLTQFLKTNNINYQDIFDQIFNIKNNFSQSEDVPQYEDKEYVKDEDTKSMNDLENDYDYELLINKLNNIQHTMKQLFLEISKEH